MASSRDHFRHKREEYYVDDCAACKDDLADQTLIENHVCWGMHCAWCLPDYLP